MSRKCLVTGGAGFIGSNLVKELVSLGYQVVVYDNLVTGTLVNLESLQKSDYEFVNADVLDFDKLNKAMAGCELVVHFAANADVRGGIKNTRIDLEQNVIATWNVCEAARINKVSKLAFSSSATVYGEPEIFPTPESNELIQTSVYGASKLAGEAYLQAFSEYFDIKTYIFRFVSWIGEHYSHGVIFDFINKLHDSPGSLEILGDGKQKKSYLYVKDGVSAIMKIINEAPDSKNVYNLGHDEWLNVVDLADIICDEMKLDSVEYHFTGGKRGWLGDSPFVHLDTSKLKSLGWKPETSIEEGIRRTVRFLLDHPEILKRRKI